VAFVVTALGVLTGAPYGRQREPSTRNPELATLATDSGRITGYPEVKQVGRGLSE